MNNTTINRTKFAETVRFFLDDQKNVTIKDVSWKNGAHVKRGNRKVVETWFAPTKDTYYVCVTDAIAETIAKSYDIQTKKNCENKNFPVRIIVTAADAVKMAQVIAMALDGKEFAKPAPEPAPAPAEEKPAPRKPRTRSGKSKKS